MGTIKSTFSKVLGMITRPKNTFGEVEDEGFRSTLKYFLVILLVPALILFIGSAIFYPIYIDDIIEDEQSWAWITLILLVPVSLIIGLITMLLNGIVLHLFVWILGGRSGLRQTYKALAYGSTPFVISIWFVPFGFLAVIWSLVLTIVGIWRLHHLSILKATISVLVAPAIFIVIGLAIR